MIIDTLLADKIFVLIKVIPILIVLFILPGLMLRKILNKYTQSPLEGSIAMDFSLGYSFMLIPGLIALYALLLWQWFFIIWIALILVLAFAFIILHYKNRSTLLIRLRSISMKKEYLPYQIIAFAVLLFTFIILFLKGGHFIGDHQHHLAYIQKLLHNDVITPWVPMYEGAREIPYNYAYDVNFLFSAIVVKLSGVDLNLYWDISPALFFIISFSAFTYFYKLVLYKYDTKKFYAFFVIGFIIYQLINWDRKLDFEFMPIPDQFARNIFLPLILALFVKYGRIAEDNRNPIYFIYSFLLLASIIFTHVYSYMVLILVGGAYTVVNFYGKGGMVQKVRVLNFFVITMTVSIFLFVLRIYKSTFSRYIPSVSSFVDGNLILILSLLFLIIIVLYLLMGKIEFLALTFEGNSILRKIGFGFTVLVVIGIAIFLLKNNAYYISTIPEGNDKYYRFINDFSYPWFMYFLMGLPIPLTIFRKRVDIDKSVLVFLWSTSLVILLALISVVNILLSKFFMTVYIRRFVFLHDVYLGISVVIVSVILFTNITKRISDKRPGLAGFISPVSIFLLVLMTVPLAMGLLLRLKDETFNREYILSEDNVFDYIRDNVEPWSVIASYKYAAMDVVAQTQNYFVSSKTVHSPRVPSERDRQITTFNIFYLKENIDNVLVQLNKYNASYILTEHDNSGLFAPKYNLEGFNKKLSEFPDIFKKVYVDSTYVLYKINYEAYPSLRTE